VIADRSGCAKARDSRSVRPRGGDKTHGIVVPVDDPCTFHGSPAKTFDLEFNRRSDRPGERRHFETLRHFDAVLRHRLVVDESRYFVNSAEIFWNREARIEMAGGIDVETTERCRSLRVFLLKW
jgi:hypothetical protein